MTETGTLCPRSAISDRKRASAATVTTIVLVAFVVVHGGLAHLMQFESVLPTDGYGIAHLTLELGQNHRRLQQFRSQDESVELRLFNESSTNQEPSKGSPGIDDTTTSHRKNSEGLKTIYESSTVSSKHHKVVMTHQRQAIIPSEHDLSSSENHQFQRQMLESLLVYPEQPHSQQYDSNHLMRNSGSQHEKRWSSRVEPSNEQRQHPTSPNHKSFPKEPLVLFEEKNSHEFPTNEDGQRWSGAFIWPDDPVQSSESNKPVEMRSTEVDEQQIALPPNHDSVSFSDLGSQQQFPKLKSQFRRPIMYTYYQKAVTDMTDEADSDLLENWYNAWFDAGWQPRVLDESHARTLPEFDSLVQLVGDSKHIGSYNMACYIRWIAMAAVGGGFMSDYDTFPLNHFLRHGRKLPFDGELTVWSNHVPALVSGNGSEYLRMAKRIGISMQKHVAEQQYINLHGPREAYRYHVPWSDMLALSEIYKFSNDMYIKKFEVVHAADVLQVEQWTEAHCYMTDGMRAIHFSHKAMSVGKQAYRGAIHRGTVARQFLNTWHNVCKYTPVADA